MTALDHPVIGIIGGMGPQATVELVRRVIAMTPAEDDVDHIHMIIDNNPKVPSRIAALIEGTGADPTPELVRMARGLEASGATLLAMPCNTAHVYLPAMTASVSIPMLDMVSLAADRVAAMPERAGRIGLLASTAVLKTGLYARALMSRGFEVLVPESQERLMEVIRSVKRGAMAREPRQALQSVASELVTAGAGVLLVACTELSVLPNGLAARLPVVDALDVLAEEIVAFGKREPR
jgi:aspartate racemase